MTIGTHVLHMSEHSDFKKAVVAMKQQLDVRRERRRAEEREAIRKTFTRERTGVEGIFRVRDSAPFGVRLSFTPFSAQVHTLYRRGFTKPLYRDKRSGRFITRVAASDIRAENRTRTAYNTMMAQFPNMTAREAIDRVNRLTELSISRQMGEDVQLEINDLFGYPAL